MADIILTTLNAKYIHAAFGLRYLLANMGELRGRAQLVEFDINQRPLDIAEVLLALNPQIIGFGIYIWNVAETTEVVAAIKRVRLDIPVRQAPLPALLSELQRLLDRGVKHFKFVDRTFNLNLNTSRTLLQFFLERYQPGLFFHFEMIPDRLPEPLRELIAQFPPGALQFEVGVQSFNEEVCRLISRRQDFRKLEDNFHFLRQRTGVYIHADLIAGLPGETLESFAAGFDRLIALEPQEIQVGILKRLRGTPIVRHDEEWEMIYSANAPYEILQNKLIDFATMQRL